MVVAPENLVMNQHCGGVAQEVDLQDLDLATLNLLTWT